MSITDEETKRFLLDEIEHLQAENAALLKMNKYLDLMVGGVQARLVKAREALRFYAGGHVGPDGKPQEHEYRALCERCHDRGERALHALKEIGE